jgi:hypothetical protein
MKGNVMKTTRGLSFVVLAAAMTGAVLAAVPGVLDGKSFAVTMKLADGQDVENTYTFKYGTVESALCVKSGYPGGAYTTTVEGEKTFVSGTLTNDRGDSRTIHATIVGSLMDGTVDVYEDGKMTGLTISSRPVAPKV